MSRSNPEPTSGEGRRADAGAATPEPTSDANRTKNMTGLEPQADTRPAGTAAAGVLRGPTRRQLIVGLTAAVALLQVGGATIDADADDVPPIDPLTRDTLEAFADTVIPGEKRSADDKVIAGAAPGPGAVQAGAVAVLTLPQLPLTPLLPALATLINTRATTYAATHLVKLDRLLPPFVGLPFEHRIGLLKELLAPGLPNKLFTLVAAIASLAFDTAGHLHTPQAAGTHPGLTFIRLPRPDDDGLWRYPKASYGRVLARRHPDTTPSGSPA